MRVGCRTRCGSDFVAHTEGLPNSHPPKRARQNPFAVTDCSDTGEVKELVLPTRFTVCQTATVHTGSVYFSAALFFCLCISSLALAVEKVSIFSLSSFSGL